MASALPAHYGATLTPTLHHTVPPNIDPSRTQLPKPFVVVVTGAGKGLGYHISLAYAQAGCTGISISSRTQADLETLAAELKKINPAIQVLRSTCDTTSEASVAALEHGVRQQWGRVDAVVANAGIISRYVTKSAAGPSNLPIGLDEDADWARVLDVNLLGTWRVAKAFFPLLAATRDGPQTLIVNSSMAAHSTSSLLTPIAYNVSKVAVNRLVEHVDNDHREKQGIHAYALHPGAVLTPQTQGHRAGAGLLAQRNAKEGGRDEGTEKSTSGEGEADLWAQMLNDDIGLAGAMCVWLSKEKRGWLSGRFVSVNWDVEELDGMKEDIVNGDKLKFRMVV